MDIEVLKKIIEKYEPWHQKFVAEALKAEAYYRKENDIVQTSVEKKKGDDTDPLRSADNRIPSNYYSLLVNQKASYMFTAPPLFDINETGNDENDKKIIKALGDGFAKVCKELCINASNSSVAWLHYWINTNGEFKYGVVDSKQIIAIYSNDLEKLLLGVLRQYDEIDEETGEHYIIYEYWTDKKCQAFRKLSDETIDSIVSYDRFATLIVDTSETVMSDAYRHNFDEVPFIPFSNNNTTSSDLGDVKKLIDAYDKVYSGFLNDLEDIQQLIFVLSGYGDADLQTFLADLKRYKTIKVDADADKPGVETLTIQIPVEAREKMLDITRKAIFEQGQGLDYRPENYGNSSGVALKFMYAPLEIKCGLTETEFKLAFNRFIRVICKHFGIACDSITQTWTRTAITNDTEQVQIANDSIGVISHHTVLKSHPLVEDVVTEEEQIKKEKEEAKKEAEDYKNAFAQKEDEPDEVEDGEE